MFGVIGWIKALLKPYSPRLKPVCHELENDGERLSSNGDTSRKTLRSCAMPISVVKVCSLDRESLRPAVARLLHNALTCRYVLVVALRPCDSSARCCLLSGRFDRFWDDGRRLNTYFYFAHPYREVLHFFGLGADPDCRPVLGMTKPARRQR